MISPAPPSKRTLSGNTTAARPLVSRIVAMCCTKLSCLWPQHWYYGLLRFLA